MLENKYNHSLLHGSNVNIITILIYILYINLTKNSAIIPLRENGKKRGNVLLVWGWGVNG